MREVTGTSRHRGLRSAVAQAAADFLASLPPASSDAVRAYTPVEGAVRMASGEAGPDADAAHAALAALAPALRGEWTHRPTGMATDLGRRCDRILRDRLDEEARADADAA